MSEPAIQAEGLVREFKKGPRAVDAIDLAVQPGEIYGFLGPNGAGKSTTVHMLTTLLPPTSGSARVAGFDVIKQGPQVRMHIGAALQEAALDPLLTGREHLRLQASLQGIPRAQRKARADELLARVGLRQAADRKVRGYSGGMKRRLDLALALVHRPKVLFLDEPTTGLDPEARADLWNEVLRLSGQEGLTVLLTTHYLEEADRLAGQLAIVDHGRIVAEGTPEELKAGLRGDSVQVELVDPDTDGTVRSLLAQLPGIDEVLVEGNTLRARVDRGATAVPEVLGALEDKAIPVVAVTVSRPSLDDVYLQLTGRSFRVTEEAA